ncbi:phage holin family protein [uncultured Prevotella sp.]|uniref:phage holin family protein n=1 Tax=uncultured Prevotella sp. TaxID=159272 RepID=UPI00266635A6|nr:phage holin family protein [uncultured Prevotella sp.]
MFSTDKNIETIAQLIEVVRHYIGLQSKYMKLDVIDKIVRLFTALIMVALLSLLLFIGLIYLSFAAVYALEPLMGTATAFACIAGVYFVVLLLFVVFRKKWIERPLVRFLASMLMQE